MIGSFSLSMEATTFATVSSRRRRLDGTSDGEEDSGGDGFLHHPSHRSNSRSSRSTSSSEDDSCPPSAFPSRLHIWEWSRDWKKLLWMSRPARALLWIDSVVFLGVLMSEILIFETSTPSVREVRHSTAIFPLYVPIAAGFAFACKWQGSAALPNFLGLLAGRIYTTARNGDMDADINILYYIVLSLIGMLEVQIAADFLRRRLCRNERKTVPTIDTVREALGYFVVVFAVSFIFEALSSFVECTTELIKWSMFSRLWSTRWLGVLASWLTISPALIHLLAYRPRYSHLFRPSKVVEFVLLLTGTISVLALIIFSHPFTTVIRPLPYLLYPLLIFSVFRFNRLGWTIVVAAIAYFCSWGSLHYKSSALYYTSGSTEKSSPKLILQIELFMSVLGVVAIALAAAVREKKQLTKDLHNMNQKLEDAVSKRTQELIRANQELQISQAHAEKANHAKSDFLANMSHEIRTPIHGILGLTALLLQSELSADQLESLLSVKDCADLLLHIINSILDLAKIEAGRLEVESVPFSIRKVLSSTLRMLQVRAKDRGLQLLWKVDSDVPALIAGDPGKLQQCLLNLVGNALKFTHKGSVRVHISLHPGFESSFSHVLSVRKENTKSSPRKSPSLPARLRSWASWPSSDLNVDIGEDNITSSVIDMFDTQLTESYLSSKGSSNRADIMARAMERQKAEIRESERKEYVLVEVRDTGIGIRKENVIEMFNPFTQADASTSRLYGGTGLGLSIVQRFVELLGGKIWVESEIGKGSVFSFVVPFRRVENNDELKGMKTGNPSVSVPSSFAVFQPLLASIEKPPRVQKRSNLQHTTLGKGRRAHSLNTLMKNLKFTTSSQSNDAEPLLQMTFLSSSEDDSGLKRSSGKERHEVDTRELSMVTTEKTSVSLGEVEITGPSSRFEKLPGNSHKEHSEPAQLTSMDREFVSINRSADPEADQLLTAVHVDNVSLVKDHSLQPSRSVVDTGIVDNSVAGYTVESSSSAPPGIMAKARESYRDLEMGLIGTSRKHDVVDIDSGETKGSSKSDDPLSRAVLSKPSANLEPVEILDSIRNIPPQEPQLPNRPSGKGKLHVLLAEDNLINQKVATRQLQRFGHTVTIVGDGLQALNVIRSNHDAFDLVLMDIQMPMMDGLEATERIRAEEVKYGWSRLPILGLTAHAISGYQDTCLSHGMDAYLGKPFDINQLLTIIQKVT